MDLKKSIFKNQLIVFSIIVSLILILSCSKSDDDSESDIDCSNWSSQVLDSFNALSNAASLYTSNPTNENCLNFKDKGNEYINIVERFINCIPSSSIDDIDDSINQTREAIDELDCN